MLYWLPKLTCSKLSIMPKNILITGATGLVGRQLLTSLQALGYQVSILTRKPITIAGVKVFLWDVYEQKIDKKALEGIDTIIHLAGEGIADQKWTLQRKQEIIDSRVQSAKLLYQTIKETKAPISTFISASAVGYYGDRKNEVLTEESGPGKSFLADCCVQWENSADEGLQMGIRVVKIRIGLILTKNEGALAAMDKPIRYFAGAPLGSGKQWMPWIHLDDVVRIFVAAAENTNMTGAYQACAPFPVTNKFLIKTIAGKINRPVWPIHVPAFVLKLMMGEMSILPLMSTNTLANKLLETGYKYSYVNLDVALEAIYHNRH
jgi:uncharacterized protein (TIGR01777 family)